MNEEGAIPANLPEPGTIAPIEVRLFWPTMAHARPTVAGPGDAAGLLAPVLADADVQRCAVLYLDAARGLLATEVLAVGTVERVIVDAWVVFRSALTEQATAIVVGQSHPSGDPHPTVDDLRLVRALVDAGRLVHVSVLDHLIVCGSRWVSALSRLPEVSRWGTEVASLGEPSRAR